MPSPASVPSSKQSFTQSAIGPSLPRVGEWLWTCRAGFESDLADEFASHRATARPIEPGLVATMKRPNADLIFARQGMPVHAAWTASFSSLDALVERICGEIRRAIPAQNKPLALHVFTTDSDAGRRLLKAVALLQPVIAAKLEQTNVRLCADGAAAHAESGLIAQVCLLSAAPNPRDPADLRAGVAVGVASALTTPSQFPGGQSRVRRPEGAPSRSAHKLAEALVWLGHGPEAGEAVVDLGAAPGGFSQVLVERRCQVVAVDLGKLVPAVAARVRHVRMNAFHFAPDEPADWVVCDMAYRPLEVAALLSRWGRNGWARFLLGNFKLPMKKRVDVLARIREILERGGWTGLRVKQLYHDRDEVTLFAWRSPGFEAHAVAEPKRKAPPRPFSRKPTPPPTRSTKQTKRPRGSPR